MSIDDDLNPNTPPPFVKLKPGATKTELAESWDAWSVKSTGDPKKDYLLGVEYCDIALRKVRATDNPFPVSAALMTMVRKLGSLTPEEGMIEKGFLDRLTSLAADRRQQLDTN